MKTADGNGARFTAASLLVCTALFGCGQENLVLPPSAETSGACGAWYPNGEADAGDVYAYEEGKTLPCDVFESARLDGTDTYISVGSLYLDAVHGVSEARSAVFVISAENCPSCGVLVQELAAEADRIEAAGAQLFDVTFCDNTDRTDCDFDLNRAVDAATAEGWLVDRWPVTNDAEGHLKNLFKDTFPTVIVARLSDIQVVSVDRVPDAGHLLELLESL